MGPLGFETVSTDLLGSMRLGDDMDGFQLVHKLQRCEAKSLRDQPRAQQSPPHTVGDYLACLRIVTVSVPELSLSPALDSLMRNCSSPACWAVNSN